MSDDGSVSQDDFNALKDQVDQLQQTIQDLKGLVDQLQQNAPDKIDTSAAATLVSRGLQSSDVLSSLTSAIVTGGVMQSMYSKPEFDQAVGNSPTLQIIQTRLVALESKGSGG